MKLQFYGAAGVVTGSRTLVTTATTRLLVDCGLFQGHKANRVRNWNPLEIGNLDGVLLTHAHIDHSGWVPALIAHGYEGPIYCSAGTADLAAILWPDSGRIQEDDAAYANRKRSTKHEPALPLYTEAQAIAALKQIEVVPFGKKFTIGDLTCDLQIAGHILGASGIRIASSDRSVFFSGDVGRPHDAVVPAPAPPPSVDLLVMESTYGGRKHPTEDREAQLAQLVTAALEREGMVLIPSFAVGRAQGLLWAIYRLMKSGRIPRVPVFLDSPMATRATAAFSRHPEILRLSADQMAKMCEHVTFIGSVEESKALHLRNDPFILLAASGMLTGGRVLHHLMNRAGVKRNLLLFAGFQVAGTRGAQLVAGKSPVRVYGKKIKVRCQVAEVAGFSAHADEDELVDWLQQAPTPPSRVILNHGEPDAADALRLRLQDAGYRVDVASEGVAWDVESLAPLAVQRPVDRVDLNGIAKRATGFEFGSEDNPIDVQRVLRAIDRGELPDVPLLISDEGLAERLQAELSEADRKRVKLESVPAGHVRRRSRRGPTEPPRTGADDGSGPT